MTKIENNELVATLTVVPIHNEIRGTLFVNSRNSMKGKFNIIAIGNNDLDSSINVRAVTNNDMESRITIRVQRDEDIVSRIDVKYRDNEDIHGFMIPMSSDYLLAGVDIRPNGRMFGIFDIIEPPRVTDKLIPIKDSTTRTHVDYKFINYGNTSTMMVGSNADEVLRSFIQFDFAPYPQSLVVINAKIRLYLGSKLLNRSTLQLWTADRKWDETGITDANRPFSNIMVSDTYTINDNENYIEFEVLDYVQEIITSGKVNDFGLIIKSKDDTSYLSDSFFTRESSKKPYLEFTYFDTRVWSTDKSDLTSTLFTYGASVKDLNSTLTVKSDRGNDDITATMYVHRYDTPVFYEQKGFIAISQPEVKSTMIVAKAETYDFVAKITVRRSKIEDVLSTLDISVPELHSTMYIKHRDDLQSSMIIRANGESDLTSTMSVSVPELYSTLYVMYRDDLIGHLTIQQNIEDFIASTLTVNQGEINGYLVGRALDGSDLASKLSVRVIEENNLISMVNITSPELIGTLLVVEVSDIDSTILIRQNDKSILVSSLTSNMPELTSTLNIMVSEFLDAYITVNIPEINSNMHIRAIDNNDIQSFMYPRVINVSDLNAYLNTINKYRSGAYYYIL